MTNQYEDLIKAGVIDPTKVVRTALENAASAATMLLTTQATVSDKPQPKEENSMPGGMNPGMMGWGMM